MDKNFNLPNVVVMAGSGKDYEKAWDRLTAFEEAGSLREFMDYMDSEEGRDWLDPVYDNWLIRRDTVRKAAFEVMRRELNDG